AEVVPGEVERAGEVVAGPVLQRRQQAGALQLVRDAVVLGTADHEVAIRIIGVTPGRLVLDLRRIGFEIDAKGYAEGVIGKLVHVHAIHGVAVVIDARSGRQRGKAVPHIVRVDGGHRARLFQWTNGAHVHGAGQALSDQAGAGRHVHDHAVEPARRVLVVLHVTVVRGADLLAPVHQRGAEVGTEAVDGEHLRTAAQRLYREARQAPQRVGDAGARQLADLFGGNRFDDLVGVALDRGSVLQAACITPHVD